MNMEELKLIADTITSLGAQGKEAFIWWLLLDKGLPFLLWSFFIGALYKCVGVFRAYAGQENFFIECRNALGYGSGTLINSETTRVQAKIRELISAHAKENGRPYR